ncbi:MAG: VirB8/TrbF family protein [Cardiobacteriaceae bacterium]|nr:VirB8/TrbF family protein [Cardiobacteriaceae bacterium]
MNNTKNIKDISSPYLAARREWNERYGDYIHTSRMWRVVGILGLLVGIVSTGGTIYFAGQNKLIPYVVEVDKRGATVEVYRADTMQSIDSRVVRAQLAQFIRDLRSVSADMTVEKNAIRRLYTHLNSNSQASSVINKYFKENDPFRKAQKKTVGVDILQLLPLSEKTWQIEWSEQEYGRDGKILGNGNFTATVTVSLSNNIDEQSILSNLIGMSIDELHFSADFKDKVKGEDTHEST